MARLNEHGSGDGDVMREVTRRQIFNWLSRMPTFERLEKIQQVSRTDLGLLWTCVQLEPERVQVNVMWGDAQLGLSEAEEMLADVKRLAEALATKANWSGDVRGFFEGR